MTDDSNYFKVSGGSDPLPLATAVAHELKDGKPVNLRAIGASAVNQAVKAVAIARGHVASGGHDLVCRPGFQTVESRDGEISAIVLRLTTV